MNAEDIAAAQRITDKTGCTEAVVLCEVCHRESEPVPIAEAFDIVMVWGARADRLKDDHLNKYIDYLLERIDALGDEHVKAVVNRLIDGDRG